MRAPRLRRLPPGVPASFPARFPAKGDCGSLQSAAARDDRSMPETPKGTAALGAKEDACAVLLPMGIMSEETGITASDTR